MKMTCRRRYSNPPSLSTIIAKWNCLKKKKNLTWLWLPQPFGFGLELVPLIATLIDALAFGELLDFDDVFPFLVVWIVTPDPGLVNDDWELGCCCWCVWCIICWISSIWCFVKPSLLPPDAEFCNKSIKFYIKFQLHIKRKKFIFVLLQF